MLVNSRMLPWQQNEIHYHINQHTPSDSVQMLQAVNISFFPSSFLSIYLTYLFVPSFLAFFLSSFLHFVSNLLFYFLLLVFIYFVVSCFLVSLLRASIIYSFSLSLLSSILYFFLPFRKLTDTLTLKFNIKKPEYWMNGKSTARV